MWFSEINYVYPDLAVVGDRAKTHVEGCIGVPELIIEVIDPSTAQKDRKHKYNRYEQVGANEYWLVDHNEELVTAFTLQETNRYGRPDVYTDTDIVSISTIPDIVIDLNTLLITKTSPHNSKSSDPVKREELYWLA
ncbi:Uma2 family endonuclease [Desulfosporosinus lacus]|uniref:Putative restriction endonuclease n=1 Tax=Desulfosporosinus lacus DSM 15449 TaxID=1121420 RepID=A0A1M5QFS4_9FIRM|nr:Uma2 family endonuclease [Desulfosporosinus lacus]SHH12700.1 Putative restriction endonuclease [Desulfosporosinus lacus DSM 15449]